MRISRPLLVDAGLTAGVMVGLSITVSVATEPRSRPVDAGAYVLACLVALPILVRRRWPVGALVASAVLLTVYYASNYPGFSPAFALPVQMYFASLAGRWRWAAGITGFFLLAGYVVIMGIKHEPPLQSLSDSLPQVALMAMTILFGEYVRRRRELAAETRERLRQAEAGREREAARRVAEERLRIARELHDTVAHSMVTIIVQAGSALHLLGERDDGSRAALAAIRRTGKEALDEIRATLGELRDEGGGEPVPEYGLDRLANLLDAVRAAGLVVDVVTDGTPRLTADADHAAYRILQESLTNVLRHAGPAAAATVSLSCEADELVLRVADDGPGPAAGTVHGNGLNGMRERAETVGGTLHAAPGDGEGFTVTARLPMTPEGAARRTVTAPEGAAHETVAAPEGRS